VTIARGNKLEKDGDEKEEDEEEHAVTVCSSVALLQATLTTLMLTPPCVPIKLALHSIFDIATSTTHRTTANATYYHHGVGLSLFATSPKVYTAFQHSGTAAATFSINFCGGTAATAAQPQRHNFRPLILFSSHGRSP
jgi:hypothetical protein